MAIVCISRGSASGGKMLADALAKKFGYREIGREDILKRATKFGVSEEELKHVLVEPPTFWERASHKRARYLAYFRFALCEEVKEGKVIYHGNAGHLLLPPEVPALRIRLVAPLEFRQRMLIEREGMNAEDALEYILKVDEQRRRWTKFLYGADPLDPLLYDLVINLHQLGLDGAVDVASAALERPEFKITEEAKKVISDHHLACKVEIAILNNKKTTGLDVKAEAKDGVVYLSGKLRSANQVENVLEVAKAVEGVVDVNREKLDAPPVLV